MTRALDTTTVIASAKKSPPPIVVAVTNLHFELSRKLLPQVELFPELRVTPNSQAGSADVLLVLKKEIDEFLLTELETADRAAQKNTHRTVLISDPPQRQQVSRLFAAGVVGLLPCEQANQHSVRHALALAHQGRSTLPDTIARWVADEFRDLRKRTPDRVVTDRGPLTVREISTLRLLAEGASTIEVAERMNYSPRTISKIIRDVLVRLDLRNQTHAVSYAMQIGAI